MEITTPGEAGRTYKGFVQNFDNRLDPASGTIRVRAHFPNPDASLVRVMHSQQLYRYGSKAGRLEPTAPS